MIVVGTAAATLAKPTTDTFSIPGIPSEQAADLQQELFPEAQDAFDQATVNVVVAAPEGQTLTDPGVSKAVDALVADLQGVQDVPAEPALANPGVAGPAQVDELVKAATEGGTPRAQAVADAEALSPLSDDGRVGLITFAFDVETVTDVDPASQDAVRAALDDARDDGLEAEANGQGMQSFAPRVASPS